MRSTRLPPSWSCGRPAWGPVPHRARGREVQRFSDGFVGATAGESRLARGATSAPVFAYRAPNAKHYHQSADGATLFHGPPTCGQFSVPPDGSAAFVTGADSDKQARAKPPKR